jgi:hypothetical protein
LTDVLRDDLAEVLVDRFKAVPMNAFLAAAFATG